MCSLVWNYLLLACAFVFEVSVIPLWVTWWNTEVKRLTKSWSLTGITAAYQHLKLLITECRHKIKELTKELSHHMELLKDSHSQDTFLGKSEEQLPQKSVNPQTQTDRDNWKNIYDALKRTAMHYRAISYVNLPTTYDEAILAQFVVHHATDSDRTIRVECRRCHHTCQIFKCRFAVGELSVNCWYTAGRQYTDRLLGELFFTFTCNPVSHVFQKKGKGRARLQN